MSEQPHNEDQFVNDEQATETTPEEVRAEEARAQADRLAEELKKFAEQSTYAAKGFAGFVSERAREFYDEQKAQYQAQHPDSEKEPGAKEFLEQLRLKLNEFAENLTKGFQEMVERGRTDAETRGAESANTTEQAAEAAADDAVGETVVAEDAVVDAQPEGENPQQF